MQFKRLRRRFRRQLKRQQRQVEHLSANAEETLERNFWRRLAHLQTVRRFVAGWIVLMALIIGCLVAQFQSLSNYYQKLEPVPGGIYTEGMVGSITNINPIYATNDVDRSLSRLLFAGLLTYDANGKLVPCLASSYQVAADSKTYTVHLKHGLTWQDGKPITASDVAFTFNTIKDPDAQSPLLSAWQRIAITTPDPYTVQFVLPSALADFPYMLTTGIVPKHLLAVINPVDLRSADFNTITPVGAGPFMWHGLQVSGNNPADSEEQVALLPFSHYVLGEPKLDEFIMRAYTSEDHLRQVFQSGQLSAAAGLSSVPADKPDGTQVHSLIMSAGTYVFFKTTSGVLADAKVRQALVLASKPDDILGSLGYMTRPVVSPLLAGQLAFNKAYAQKTGDLTAARLLLQQDGWLPGTNGIFTKNNQPLTFNMIATDTPEYQKVTDRLRSQWRALGAKVHVQLVTTNDYNSVLANHDYDATLYGIAIGQDPDVYAYWDSSQADVRSNNRLNLSEWNNKTADDALESGRTRLDPRLRAVKYAPFLQAWQQDAPALGLYQPRFLYLTRGTVYGLTTQQIDVGTSRYNGIQNWEIRSARVTQE
jgi:peptide/nickel transport system substrate-binding protein